MLNAPPLRAPLTIWLLMVLHCSAFGQERDGGVLGIEQLRTLAGNRRARVDSLAVSYDVFQEKPSDSPTGHIPHLFRSVLVDASTERFFLDRSMEVERPSQDVDSEPATATMTLAFDGEIPSAFLPDEMVANVKQGADANGLVESGIWGVMLLGEPQEGGLGIDDGSLESLLAHGTVREQLELVDDAPCHVVDAFHDGVQYATVWLDADRNMLPMRFHGYGSDGAVSSSVTVEAVVFLEGNQLWLPGSWHTEIRARGETLRSYTVVEPESIEVNPPFTDEVFRPQFPAGTIVTDEIAGIVYRVSDAGEIGEVLYERPEGYFEWIPVGGLTSAKTGGEEEPVPQPQVQGQPSRRTDARIIEGLADMMEFAIQGRRDKARGINDQESVRASDAAATVENPAPDSERPSTPTPTTTAPTDVGLTDDFPGQQSAQR